VRRLSEAKLPEGTPSGKGLSLDEAISGQRTFAKPQDDSTHYDIPPPHEMRKRVPQWDSWVDSDDYGDGATDKTPYPYRDGIPNAHNASVDFVAALYLLEQAVPRIFSGSTLKVGATIIQILTGLNPKVLQRATKCTASLKRADLKNLRWIFAVDCGNGLKAVKMKAIRPRANIIDFTKMNLELTCSCPAWRWLGSEFHAKGEGFLLDKPRGTATLPVIKDPAMINRVCKHVAAVLSLVRNWTLPFK
jgi:hypothetical protein